MTNKINKTNNCLIAEFLGYKKDSNGYYPIENITPQGVWDNCNENQLEFGDSFDWLIPVVQKIKECDVENKFNFNICFWDIEILYNKIIEYINKIGAEN